jgi:hypothetical protein
MERNFDERDEVFAAGSNLILLGAILTLSVMLFFRIDKNVFSTEGRCKRALSTNSFAKLQSKVRG